MQNLRRVALVMFACFAIACSGGAMNETESGAVTGGESTVTTSDSTATATENQDSSSGPPPAAVVAEDDAEAAQLLAEEILSGWEQPGRDSRTEPRHATVRVRFGHRGQLVRWDWRRRSPQNLFNAAIAEFLDGLVDVGRRYALPSSGSSARDFILDEGIELLFADDDF